MPIPDEVDARMLDKEVRQELRSLTKETADLVARHLVVTGQLLDDDPETALVHARAARALAGRVAAVREAAGLAAYSAGEWSEALTELRAARRISGSAEHLAVMADCERALDRPERALTYADDPDVARLEQATRVELVIVLSGARRDMRQPEAAVLEVQEPARRTKTSRPWAARLWYAYADALLAAGRATEAREWFVAAAEIDTDGETDAAERLLELDGVVFEELEIDGDAQGLADGVRSDDVPADDVHAPTVTARQEAPPVPAGQQHAPAADGAPATRAVDVTPVAEPAPPGPDPASAPDADQPSTAVRRPAFADGGDDQPTPQAGPLSDAVPGVSFQAPDDVPDDDDELRLFD